MRRRLLCVLATVLLASMVTGLGTIPVQAAPGSSEAGYWLVARDGGVFSFGPGATFYGSAGGTPLNKPVVGIVATPAGNGYWLVASDGGVFAYGGAGFYGSTGGLSLNQPIVAMAATPSGKGYWLLGADGGVFSFGDAVFHGSAAGMATGPAAAIQADPWTTPSGGYRILMANGDILQFDTYYNIRNNHLVLNDGDVAVGMTTTPDAGFYGVTRAGIVKVSGAAYPTTNPFVPDFGSITGRLSAPIVDIGSTPPGANGSAGPSYNSSTGYVMVASDGGVFTFGDAQFFGSTGDQRINAPIVGIAVRPNPPA